MAEVGNIAYVFPGQGSQKVGMGRDLFDNSPYAKSVFLEADNVLGFSLSKLCFEGPEEELRQTVNAQPALLTMSIACYQAAINPGGKDHVPAPTFLAGHSLGEYTALVLAEVLDFSTALFLARERGRLMHEAGQKTPGGMAAILGMDEAAVKEICQTTGTWLANINCPGQLVISGARDNIVRAIDLVKSKSIRAIPLQVSGAFHSPLMQPAAEDLSAIIGRLHFKEPVVPIVANTSAQQLSNAKAIKEELMLQLTNSVQWQRSVEFMISNGISTFIEIGSGNVLTGLAKRINKNVKTLNIGSMAEIVNIKNQ